MKQEQAAGGRKQKTYWNGEPTLCRRVLVVVGESPMPSWWCAGLAGTKRKAVEVHYFDEPFYLDDEDGSGWNKVTIGMGGPRTGHRSLPVAQVLEVLA